LITTKQLILGKPVLMYNSKIGKAYNRLVYKMFLCVVGEVCFVCICVIKFEVLLISSIAATASVFDLVDFNIVIIWKCF
jgi:hypothetical protein